MAEKPDPSILNVQYDNQTDILTFTFTETPQPAIAEEAADEVWVRYDLNTAHIITIDVLNFSAKLENTYGPELIYQERDDIDYLTELVGLSLPIIDSITN